MTYANLSVSALAIGGWNLATMVPEYLLLVRVYKYVFCAMRIFVHSIA